MAIKTYTEQLESVQAAITKLENGVQSVRMPDGQDYTYPDIWSLYAREEKLMPKALREQAGRRGPRVRAVDTGR
jgi:hypothetical protein